MSCNLITSLLSPGAHHALRRRLPRVRPGGRDPVHGAQARLLARLARLREVRQRPRRVQRQGEEGIPAVHHRLL